MSSVRRRSFAIKLSAVLLAALVPLAILAGLEWFAAPPVAPNAEATRVADELDRMLQIRLKETFTIAAFPSIRVFAATEPTSKSQRATVALNELQAWVAADPQVREVFVLDRQATVVLTTGTGRGQDWGQRAFVKSPLAGKLDLSPIAHDAGEYSQYYSAPILDSSGNVAGVLVARIAAQELWDAVNSAGDADSGQFAFLVDENGVRLADGGDATRILQALAPLTPDVQARVIGERTYGDQVQILRATNLTHAAEAIRSGELDSLVPKDLDARAFGVQRLNTKPWTVIAVSPARSAASNWGVFVIPFIAAVVLSVAATFLISR